MAPPQEAKGIFKDEQSPTASPRRKHQHGHEQRDRLDEMFAKMEEQMKRAILPKIFRRQHDLQTLEAVAVAEEQQRRRAAHRAAQLKRLEERKLDCRVRPLEHFVLFALFTRNISPRHLDSDFAPSQTASRQ